MKTFLIVLFFISLIYIGSSKNKEEWKSRVVYQLLTDRFANSDGSQPSCSSLSSYCGGTFKGVKNNLQYIKNLGVDAIWISPIVKNIDGGYHGYWMSDLYSINPHFGTEQDLVDLINAAHALDIYVMVGVVGNHVGPIGTDYSQINPFNKAEHYHDYCTINQDDFLNNQWRVENCRLADLPDLKQENAYVANTLNSWIQSLVQKYNLDGIRIDTIPEVPKAFWSSFTKAAGVFQFGECFDGRADYVAGYQGAVDSMLNYPLYFQLKNVFLYSHSMTELETFFSQTLPKFPDPTVLGCFADNHDNARFLSINNDYTLFKAYLAFNLGVVGIPIIYYGGEQGFAGGNDPNNREPLWKNLNQNHELYLYIQKITSARKKVKWYNESQLQRYADGSFYAFSRGKNLFLFTNQKGQITRTIAYHPFMTGDVICNVFWYDSDCITIISGSFNVYLNNGETKIYILKGSLGDQNIII